MVNVLGLTACLSNYCTSKLQMGGKLKMFVDFTCRYKYDGSPDWNLNCNAFCFICIFLANVNDFITNER